MGKPFESFYLWPRKNRWIYPLCLGRLHNVTIFCIYYQVLRLLQKKSASAVNSTTLLCTHISLGGFILC